MLKVIYHRIPGGYVAGVVTQTGDRVQAPANYNSIWELWELSQRYGARLEEH